MSDPTPTLDEVQGTAIQADFPTLPPSGPGGASPLPAGRYTLYHEIGRGGMGAVHAARDAHLDRDVAVKVLQEGLAGTAAERRFRDEARITGQLQHPGIPPVYDLGTLPDGRPYLAMKLIKGRTLDGLLKAEGPGGRWLSAFEGICQAVGYAHAHGVIHRDLKPANVMVGAFGEVQVMDWGLAKLLDGRDAERAEDDAELVTAIRSQRDGSDATRAGSVLGTPAYMAPEQAIGAVDQLDRRTDVFGLGAVLCALLTGRPPFVGGDAESTRQLAARGKLDDALARLAGCGADPDLVALCVRCLAAEPAGRPTDGGAVAAAVAGLRLAADDRAKRAELTAAEGRVRRRVQLRLGGLAATVLLAGLLTAGLLWRRAEREWVRATEREADAVAATAREAAEKEAKAAALNDAVAARGKTVVALRRLTDELLTGKISNKTYEQLPRAREAEYEAELQSDANRAMLQDMLALWEWVAATTGDGREALSVQAEGAHRVAQVRLQMNDYAGAEAAERSAVNHLKRLVELAPAEDDYRVRLAAAHTSLSDTLRTNRPNPGGRAEAEAALRSALALETQLVAESPADSNRRFALSQTYSALSWLMRAAGRMAEAEAATRDARRLLDALVAGVPSEGKFQKALIGNHYQLGSTLEKIVGRADEAEAEYRTGCRRCEQLSALRATPLENRRYLEVRTKPLGQVISQIRREVLSGPLS